MEKIFHLIILNLLGLSIIGQSYEGYYNYQKVFDTIPELKIEKKSYQLNKKMMQDSLDIMYQNYQHFWINEIPHNAILDSTEKKLLDNKIKYEEDKLQNYQKYAVSKIIREEELIILKINFIISEEIDLFCKNKGITSIVDEKSMHLYKPCINYTNDFISYLYMKK